MVISQTNGYSGISFPDGYKCFTYKLKRIMKYKGFSIEKVSRYIFHGFDNSNGHYWNVNFDFQNAHFNTLKEAKAFVGKRLSH